MPAHAADQHEEERTDYCIQGVEEMNSVKVLKGADTRKCPEYWKPAPCCEKYEVSTHGRVRHSRTKRVRKILMAGPDRNSCCITLFDGEKVMTKSLKRLVWETFVGPVPDGMLVTSKSGMCSTAELDDLELTTAAERGTHAAKSTALRIIKIDDKGKILKTYTDSRECAKAEHYHRRTIQGRCVGHAVEACPGGYDFAYEDSPVSIRQALTRLGVDWRTWTF